MSNKGGIYGLRFDDVESLTRDLCPEARAAYVAAMALRQRALSLCLWDDDARCTRHVEVPHDYSRKESRRMWRVCGDCLVNDVRVWRWEASGLEHVGRAHVTWRIGGFDSRERSLFTLPECIPDLIEDMHHTIAVYLMNQALEDRL